MEYSSCIICGNGSPTPRFQKQSEDGEVFSLVKCGTCGLEFVNPRPPIGEIGKYYGRQYFTRRSDRGYDNYFSSELRSEIERVMEMNLADLDFFSYEKEISGERLALDIGCAAGYFVAFLCNRGWQAEGIDISHDCVNFAVNSLQVPVQQGNQVARITFGNQAVEPLHGLGCTAESMGYFKTRWIPVHFHLQNRAFLVPGN